MKEVPKVESTDTPEAKFRIAVDSEVDRLANFGNLDPKMADEILAKAKEVETISDDPVQDAIEFVKKRLEESGTKVGPREK